MLSEWQTVAVSLGAALLTGTFAVLGAWHNSRAQRRIAELNIEAQERKQLAA